MSDNYVVTALAVVAYKLNNGHALFYKDAVLPVDTLREGEPDRLVEAGMVAKVKVEPFVDPGVAPDTKAPAKS